MSTRAFFGVYIEGTTKLMYKHHDGYPEGLGASIVAQVRKANLKEWREKARGLVLFPRTPFESDDRQAQEAGVQELRAAIAPSLAHFLSTQDIGGTGTWGSESKCELARMIAEGALKSADGMGWLLDIVEGDLQMILELGVCVEGGDLTSVHGPCEWGYIVDLDVLKFQVYSGGVRDSASVEYYPNRLLAEYPLAAIPDGWTKECDSEGQTRSKIEFIPDLASLHLTSRKSNVKTALEYTCAEMMERDNWFERLLEVLPSWPVSTQRLVLEVFAELSGDEILRDILASADGDLVAKAKALFERGS